MGFSSMTVEHVPSCGRSFVSVVDSELSDHRVSTSELVCDMHSVFIGICRSFVHSKPLLVFRTENVGTMNWCTDLQACWVLKNKQFGTRWSALSQYMFMWWSHIFLSAVRA